MRRIAARRHAMFSGAARHEVALARRLAGVAQRGIILAWSQVGAARRGIIVARCLVGAARSGGMSGWHSQPLVNHLLNPKE